MSLSRVYEKEMQQQLPTLKLGNETGSQVVSSLSTLETSFKYSHLYQMGGHTCQQTRKS